MGVGFASYEIARSGLIVNERGLHVTGHNISNVNTTGYVRQQAMIKNAPVHTQVKKGGFLQFGLGADIQGIRQIRHTFLDNIYRQENTTLGYWDTRQKTFQDVQAIMAEPMESGLQSVLNMFWDSWQELSKEPDSLTIRALVKQRSEALVQQINHMGTQFERLQFDLNTELEVRINEVNVLSSGIAELNLKIAKSEIYGDSANDYRDQRNALLDRLTKLANVDINEMQDGQVDVTLGGYFLVQKGIDTRIYAAERNLGENFYVVKLEGANVEVPVKSGILKGLMESRGEVSGTIGSYENGTPNTNADVVFYVDTSTMTDPAEVNIRVDAYRQELLRRGIDAVVTTVDVASAAGFEAAVAGTTGLRAAANKYAVLITNDSISGAALESLQNELTGTGMEASIITDAPGAWSDLIEGQDGSIYSLSEFSGADFLTLTHNIAYDTDKDVSAEFSVVGDSYNIVSDMRQRLNALVNVMLRTVNHIHKSGTNMKDPATAGEDFFVTINPGRPLEMGNIRLNPALSDLSNIAASKTGQNGDNSNALEIANLRNRSLINEKGGFMSLDDYYQAIILRMGNNAADSSRIAESQGKLVMSADAQRTAVTGVSMDEEMTNMMKFKYAYDASARVLNIVDSMMETIVNRLGLAGR